LSVTRISVDFQRRQGRAWFGGPLLMAAGCVFGMILFIVYRQTAHEIAGVELQLAGLHAEASIRAGGTGLNPTIAGARETQQNLATPWGQLLSDLEAASGESGDSVALLEVEPDPEHGKVLVRAETRSLVAALGYLQRLQKARALANPLLESHEIMTDVPERPVRVQIVADWRVKS
jgi:hypothetical protein